MPLQAEAFIVQRPWLQAQRANTWRMHWISQQMYLLSQQFLGWSWGDNPYQWRQCHATNCWHDRRMTLLQVQDGIDTRHIAGLTTAWGVSVKNSRLAAGQRPHNALLLLKDARASRGLKLFDTCIVVCGTAAIILLLLSCIWVLDVIDECCGQSWPTLAIY